MSQDQQLRMLFQGKPDSHGMISTFGKRKILYHRLATFPSFRMTKSVITQGTNRCQMKDMYIIFQVVPPILLHVKWFGYYRLLKSSTFSNFSKTLEFHHFRCGLKTNRDTGMKTKPNEAHTTKLSQYESSLLIPQIAFEF